MCELLLVEKLQKQTGVEFWHREPKDDMPCGYGLIQEISSQINIQHHLVSQAHLVSRKQGLVSKQLVSHSVSNVRPAKGQTSLHIYSV